jgi:hypothetical protein
MVGYLKVDGGKFCVEYADRNVQVFWRPGAPEAVAKATRWIADALPRLEKVPEMMLGVLMGCKAEFLAAPIRKERTVEWRGTLLDGGSIKLVYFKQVPLYNDDYRDAVDTLKRWANSYLSCGDA